MTPMKRWFLSKPARAFSSDRFWSGATPLPDVSVSWLSIAFEKV